MIIKNVSLDKFNRDMSTDRKGNSKNEPQDTFHHMSSK